MKAKKKKKKLPKRRKPGFSLLGTAEKPGSPADDLQWHPVVADNEPLIDAAVVSSKVRREQLDPELRPAAQMIADALRRVAEGNDAAASEMLAEIPRSSPFASWKLFIRGLIAHYRGDNVAAEANWARLEPGCRPGRIAAVLRAAGDESAGGQDAGGETADPATVERARQVRRVRPALAEAEKLAAAVERASARQPDRRFSHADVASLVAFRERHAKLEPDLVHGFSYACVLRCTDQPYNDVFDALIARVPGPPHDPRWNLLASAYYNRFADSADRASKLLDRYLERDLPFMQLPPQFRSALESAVWNGRAVGRWHRVRRGILSPDQVADASAAAIRAVPTNAAAHRILVDFWTWAAEHAKTAALRKQYEAKLLDARRAWVEAIPDEFDQRILLIDHYLENDKIDAAGELAATITDRRSDNPLVTALPWKLELRRAMQLSKQKRNLPAAGEALEQAAQMWPKWLPDDWLPFLRAALALRGGDRKSAERLLDEVRKSGRVTPLTFDVLRFGAAQQMNVPAAEVRPLRTAVEKHAAAVEHSDDASLLDLGAAFWHLHRAGLLYRGYRNHGSKLGIELGFRIDAWDSVEDTRKLSDAAFWAAANRFWDTVDAEVPPEILTDPEVRPAYSAAILLSALLGDRWIESGLLRQLVEDVRILAEKETDPFYRHMFSGLVKQADERIGQSRGMYRGADDFAEDDDDYYDDDDEDDWDDDADNGFVPGVSRVDSKLLEKAWQMFIGTAPEPLQPLLRDLPDEGRFECMQEMLQLIASGEPPEVSRFLDILSRYHSPLELIAVMSQLEEIESQAGSGTKNKRKKARR